MRRILTVLALLFVASCGVKGDPVPPGEPEPETATSISQ